MNGIACSPLLDLFQSATAVRQKLRVDGLYLATRRQGGDQAGNGVDDHARFEFAFLTCLQCLPLQFRFVAQALVALDLAMTALLNKRADLAIAAGVYLEADVDFPLVFRQLNALSRSGLARLSRRGSAPVAATRAP